MGEVTTNRKDMEEQACGALNTEPNEVDEREEAVAAAVAVVGASARRGVVTLCASVAHIIRKNLRLQQQVKELEGRLRALERLTSEDSAASHCQECSSAISQSTSDSLPESPSSQRCGSAPPHFLAGSLRPCGGPGAAPRKASDPGSGATFLRGHTRASTGNLSRCGPTLAPFVRRKYSSISLRRVKRHTPSAAIMGRAATVGSEGSSNSLEQNSTTSTTSSRSCIVTVAEVYSTPASVDTTTTTTNNNNNNNNNNTEGEAVKLLAKKLTSVLQEDSTQQHQQEDSEDMVLCAPHPLAGCQCVLCLQLSTDSDTVPYEIVTDEGSLLPRGSAVLVRGRRVGTVVYFGHRKHQVRGIDGPAAPLLPPPAPGTHDLPADECARSLACPLGVTVQLWPPDEGEVFVPLNDVICQLDEGGDSSSGGVEEAPTLREGDDTHSNNSSSRRDSEDMNSHTAELDHTLTDTRTSQDIGRLIQDTWAEEQVHSVTKDPRHTREHLSISVAEAGHRTQGTVDKDGYGECGEDMGHHGGRHFSSVSDTSSTCESLGSRGMEDVSRGPAGYHGSRSEALPRRSKVTGSDQRCLECEGDIESRVGDLHRHVSQGPIRYHGSQSEALPRRMKVTGSDQRCLECEDDLESQYSECDKGKLQFGDTWDSGCYMSLGRHSSECSEQFSDPESEYGSTGHPWGSSLEEALNSVWQKHKHGDTLTPYLRRTPADTFVLDSEVELQDYRGHGKIREDTVC